MTGILRFACVVGFATLIGLRVMAASTPGLTGAVWAVCGTDPGTTWHETTLVFTDQSPSSKADGTDLAGYFDWKSANGSAGREFFTGTVSAKGTLILQGFRLEGAINIVTSRYTASLTADGQEIVGGKWYDGVPGIWSAVRGGTSRQAIALCEAQTA